MRKLLGLLVVAVSAAAFAVGASTVAFAAHSHSHSRTHIRGDCNNNCGGGDNGGGGNGGDCNKDWNKDSFKCHPPSPGADCTDRRLGLYSRVNNVLYICLAPKNNTPQADSRSLTICETPEDQGGQGGTYVDMDGLDYICLGPSGPQ
jgi:hypothetical protein